MLLSFREPVANHTVYGSVEGKADMRAGDLDIHIGFPGNTTFPIDDPVVPRIDCGLANGLRQAGAQRTYEIARAPGRVTFRKHGCAVFFQDLAPHDSRCAQYGVVRDGSFEWRGDGYDGSNISRALASYGAGHYAAEAVSHKVNLAPRFLNGLVYRSPQLVLDQQIWALGIQTDS